MGVCFSKKGDATSPTKVPSNDLPKENSSEKEEKKEPTVTEKKPVPALSAKKASFVAEHKETKKCEIPVKKSSQLDEEPDCKAAAAADEKPSAPLSTSSCTKEELDAILIQCGRLSRSSSGKISKETDGVGQRRYSGSKRSYDFDEERRKEVEDERDNHVSRPSPRRRAPNRERSGSRERGNSRERRVSRSPGKRSEGPLSATAISDKQKQQPAKMVSVPAREKGTTVNAETGGGNSGVKRASMAAAAGGLRSSSPRSRSPANTTRTSNENPQLQSLSRNSSRKADQSPYRRNPLAEIEDNSFRNQNGGSTSVFQKSREVDEGVRKPVSTIYSCQKAGEGISTISGSDQRNSSHISVATKQQQLKKQELAEEDKDPKTVNEIESHNPRTLTRTRSSRRSSRDLDNNPGFNQTSYASLLLEDIQYQQQQHHTAFSLPACISKACSILDAVADLNSSCSDRRSYEADQSGNNLGFARRGLLARREPFVESEMVVKDDLMEPSLHKYVTVRDNRWDLEPQESAGSNSFEGKPWSSMWEMNSIDSTGGTSMTGDIKDVEDEVVQAENQLQQKSWQRSGAPSSRKSPLTAATPLKKKRELENRSLQQGGHGYGKNGGRAFSLPVSAAST